MRVFKSRWFNKWAGKEKLTDVALLKAVEEMERGLVDADLGGYVFKKRVGLHGRGKSGGVRTLIAYQIEGRVFFIYGFAKNKRGNIRDGELKALQVVAKTLLAHDDDMLEHLVKVKELIEVVGDG